ncbi:MAG TPA: HEAT repeat domain-containing protein [Fimbriiglobus sp.]|jgi:HEAT repeat protein
MRTLGLLLLTLSPVAAQPPIVQPVQPKAIPTPLGAKPITYPTDIGGKRLPDWVRDLSDRDPAVRETAIKVIPAFGPDAVLPSTRGLIARANDEDTGVKVNAIIALGAIGARTREEAKPIVDALKLAIANSGVGRVERLHAARSLANYGILANDAISILAGISHDPSWETRRTVAMALGRVGQVPAPAAPRVKGTDRKPKEAEMDRWTPSDKAVSTLKSMMSDDLCAQVRLEAVQSLVLLGPPEVPPELYVAAVTPLYNTVSSRLKREKDKGVLIWLVMLQMRLNGADLSDDNIKKISDNLSDESVNVRVHALSALGLLGDKARPALTAIANSLQAKEPITVAAAITCLAALGDLSKPVIAELLKLQAETKDETLKALATEAIKIISGAKKK